MADVGAWSSRPVFITSTFHDMQAERDLLRNVVFPALEEKLRARRVHLEWVDLRVGIASPSVESEEAFEAQVLKVCLEEVKRSRPFLVGLIGDRYGWVPPLDRARAAVEEAAAEEREKGLAVSLTGRSLTDLEIDFGVLSNPMQRKRSLFWFRRPLPYDTMAPQTAAEYSDARATDAEAPKRAEKLEGLKEKVRAALPDHVFDYAAEWDGRGVTCLAGWARQVEDALWKELDAETAKPRPVPSWQEEEREALLDFAEDLARDFVGRAGVLDEIIKFVASKPDGTRRGLVIVGEAGSGKSALWGMLHRRPKAKRLYLLSHAAGASPRAPSIDLMLRRWVEELSTELGATTELADDARDEEVETAFASLIGRIAQTRRVLMLVDALDQFEATNRGRFMTWLPKLWPDNARLIATAIPGEATQALERQSGMRILSLPPLDATEARGMVSAICWRYHRMFEAEVIEALAARIAASGPAQGNALWLVLATEALNLLDADDFARARTEFANLQAAKRNAALMRAMIAAMPVDIAGLYGQSFDRATKLFGEKTVWGFLGMNAVSRGGWRESDFRGVLPTLTGEPWDELRFAQLRRSFRGQLRARGALAQWGFAHGQMRDAFRQWATKRELGHEKTLHTAIADHLLGAAEDDPMRVSQTMLHLIEAEDGARRAVRYYGRPSLDAASKDGATQVLTDLIMADRSRLRATSLSKVFLLLDELTRLHDLGEPFATQTALNVAKSLQFGVAQSILDRIELEPRGALLIKLRDVLEQRAIESSTGSFWRRDLAMAQDRIGDVLVAQGKLSQALKEYHESLTIREALVEVDPTNTDWQGRLSVSHVNVGDILIAQGKLTEALNSFREGLAIKDRLARADPANLDWQRDLSAAHDRIGDALVAQGYLRDALRAYRKGLKLVERIARAAAHNNDWQRDLSVSRMKIGDVLVAQGKLSGSSLN